MKRSMHNGILVLMVVGLMMVSTMAASAAAQELRVVPANAVAMQVDGTAVPDTDPDTTGVTDLPDTGRGYAAQAEETKVSALHQMLTTAMVLLVAAALALGGLALSWRYERR
jgi:hypothetical protein